MCPYSVKNCEFCSTPCIEKVKEDRYVFKTPFEQRVDEYMLCDKKTLAEMLALRDFQY